MKLFLDESKAIKPLKQTLTEADIELPIADLKEPSDTNVRTAYADSINQVSVSLLDVVSQINSILANLEVESKEAFDKEAVKTLLSTLGDELVVNLGTINKINEIIDQHNAELIQSGEENAENIISEPASSDLN